MLVNYQANAFQVGFASESTFASECSGSPGSKM